MGSLLHEGHTIQGRLSNNECKKSDDGKLARCVEKLGSVGSVRAATRLITKQEDNECLPFNNIQSDGRSVRDHLTDKHLRNIPRPIHLLCHLPKSHTPRSL